MVSRPIRIAESAKFGDDFELDLKAYELRRGGRPLKLERIPMDLLVLLIEHRGTLVTRDQIIEKIWGKDVFLDTDAGINSAIRKIRQALKDDPEQPRYVQTVSGKGYRFIAEVEGDLTASAEADLAQPGASETLPGKRISHYRVLELLGGGGMGVVYKAEDLKLGRLVALKFLPDEVASDKTAFERLQQEARAASALDHPNICSVYQFGEHEGHPFIAMQYLEGQTLREWIEANAGQDIQKRLKSVVSLAIQIADGLEAAHEKGIIHRDIKPANIFVTRRSQAKILDFGVAKFTEAGEAGGATTADSAGRAQSLADVSLTRTGESMGTPAYLSPEQIRRENVDARTDLFSFGLVLYAMATGQRAFSGDTATVIRDAVLSKDVVPPRQMNPGIPEELERIILKCLEKDPAQRYQTAADLRQDLRSLSTGLYQAAPRKLGVGVMAAGGAVLAALALFAFNAGGIRDRVFHQSAATASFKTRPSIAVLGFKNLSGKDEEAWISTALSEMLGAELASGEQLRVVPAENVARMKVDLSLPAVDTYAKDTLGKIRNQLSTDMVVHGSYLALGGDVGGKIRVDLQLQDTRAGDTIAVFSQVGTEADLGDLISRGGTSLRERLGIGDVASGSASQVRSSIPSNPEATRLYAEGLAKMRSFDASAARDLLTKAIAADPKHALSYAALSESWSALGYEKKAREEAKKAVDLSSGLSREDQLFVEGRSREAAHEWRRAVEVYTMLWEFFPDNLEYGLRLARVQASAGMGKEAMATVEKLAKQPSAADDPRIDLAEASAADQLGDLRREEAAAARAVEKGRKQGSRSLTARALSTRGSVLGALGNPTNAITLLKEAQAIFDELGDQQGVGRALNNLGIIERHQSNLAEAQKLLEQALELFRRIGYKSGEVTALNNLGNVYWDQGDMARTLVAHRQSLALSREVGDRKNEASSLNNLGGLLTLDGKLPEARQMYDQSVQLARDVGDQEGAGVALGNIADLLTRQGDLPAARKVGEEALAADRQAGAKSFEGYALQQLGVVLWAQGDLSGARARFQEAASVRHDLGEKITEAQSQFSLAQVALDSGDAAAAEAELRRLAPIFHEGGSIDDEAMTYALLAMTLVAQGKSAEAQDAAAKANDFLTKAQDFATRSQVDIAGGYVNGITSVSGGARKVSSAMKTLEAVRQRTASRGYAGLELEARLRLGEVELASRSNPGRARLQQVAKDAQGQGFLLIARKANDALGGRTPSLAGYVRIPTSR